MVTHKTLLMWRQGGRVVYEVAREGGVIGTLLCVLSRLVGFHM